MDDDLIRVSRWLSWALRHDPSAAGLVLDAQGWAPVSQVLAAAGVSRRTLDAVVAGNDKQRFVVEHDAAGVARIRASQGHSVPVDLGLVAVAPPDVLFHGTPTVNVDAIRAEGLRPGRRQQVHLSADRQTAVAVGTRRRGPATILTVDAAAMTRSGHPFYRSANGVWLTDLVPPEFIVLDEPV